MHFVSSSIYDKAISLVLSEGLSPETFEHHKKTKELQQRSKYVPIELLLEIYELADQYLEPGFSVRQGKQMSSDDYGTLGLSWKTCWRAREVLDRIERFMTLVTNQGSVTTSEENGITHCYLNRDASRRGLEISNEATFVMLISILHEVTGKKIYPTKVHLKHTNQSIGPLQDFFHCPVVFNAADNSMHFNNMDIDIPTLKADKGIQQFLVERMEEEKIGIEVNADRLLTDVHNLVKEALPSGIPSVLQVANYLGMSARTLNRRLSEKGLNFRELVQKIQREFSIELIRNSGQSMSEIAFQTGFSEQSAFNRAFKRWTGQSPVEFQRG